VRGRQRMESVHLLHLLLPHPTEGMRGDVKVRQLLPEHREELILLHFHWREKEMGTFYTTTSITVYSPPILLA